MNIFGLEGMVNYVSFYFRGQWTLTPSIKFTLFVFKFFCFFVKYGAKS